MSLVTDILDRLSGVAVLKEKLAQQDRVLEGMQRVLLDQQRDIAELKGSMKAMISIQSGGRAI
ncbi:MAG TPA: hypothetical protein VGY49_00155 [Burkholderiaceae bacterium]|nr:hypothetical protein [Burkholderiaceae bacterium]